jgi:hypothetical protein
VVDDYYHPDHVDDDEDVPGRNSRTPIAARVVAVPFHGWASPAVGRCDDDDDLEYFHWFHLLTTFDQYCQRKKKKLDSAKDFLWLLLSWTLVVLAL